jgi:hypothetical protein
MRMRVRAAAGLLAAILLSAGPQAGATALSNQLTVEGVGLTVVQGGVGLEGLGAGTRTLQVQIGGPVERAILYWAGRDFSCLPNCTIGPDPAEDQYLLLDGQVIRGTFIGQEPNDGFRNNLAYRLDITSYVRGFKYSGPGLYSFDIADADLGNSLDRLNGASLLVIYTDPSDPQTYQVQVYDGLDFAFDRVSDPTSEQEVTTPVVIPYAASGVARQADLFVAVGDPEPDRPDSIAVSDNPTIENQLDESSGPEWDADQFLIDVPAGATSTTVQVISGPPGLGGLPGEPDSALWTLAVLRIPVEGTMCALEVNKLCSVAEPPADFTCTKPLDEITMIWNGAQVIRVKAWKGAVGSTLLLDQDGIQPGDIVTVSGYAGSPNDVIWELFAAGTSTKIGQSTFHLSCSDDDMDGPEDCGKVEGNGKGLSGFVNTWILEGISGAGGSFECSPSSDQAAESCEVNSQEGVQCKQRPTAISFRYTGNGCADSSNTQAADKWSCTPGPGNPAGPVRILVSKPDGTNVSLDTGLPPSVEVGEVVTAMAANAGRADFDSDSRVRITDANGLLVEDVRLHTSCSQPLLTGDRYGSLEVVGYENATQGKVQSGAEVKYHYVVKNSGATDVFDVSVEDDALVPPTVPGSPIDLAAGQQQTLMASAFVDQTTTGTVVVEGMTASGSPCNDSDSLTVTAVGPPPCEIGPGEFKIGDNKIEWKLENTGSQVATIDSLQISWPAALGNLRKVKREGDTIFESDRAPATTTITSADWINGVTKRQIKPGETKRLIVEFQKKAKPTPSQFALTVNFKEGCSVTFTPGSGSSWVCVKPIDSLTMIWNGTQKVRIKAWKGAVGSTLLLDRDGIAPGDEVTVVGYAGSPNDVIWEVFAAGTSTKLGNSTFHVSCSDDDMDGPEDCGKPQGDGKGQSGFLNDWILEGIVDPAGVLDCTT